MKQFAMGVLQKSVAIAFTAFVITLVMGAAKIKLPVQKWEYTKVPADVAQEQLDRLGRNGWELVAGTFATRDSSTSMLYFKRPLTPKMP